MFTVKVFDEKGMEVKVVEGEFVFVVAGCNDPEKKDSAVIGKTSTNHLLRAGVDELVEACKSLSISEDCELSILSSMIRRLKDRFNAISEKDGFDYDTLEKLK